MLEFLTRLVFEVMDLRDNELDKRMILSQASFMPCGAAKHCSLAALPVHVFRSFHEHLHFARSKCMSTRYAQFST